MKNPRWWFAQGTDAAGDACIYVQLLKRGGTHERYASEVEIQALCDAWNNMDGDGPAGPEVTK